MNTNHTHGSRIDPPYAAFPLEVERFTVLPTATEIVVNCDSGQLTRVNWQERRFEAEVRLTEQELAVVLILLDDWPSYTPYARCVALFHPPAQTAFDLEEEESHAAYEAIRTIALGCQDRLARLGLHITAVWHRGLLLVASTSQKREGHTPL